MGKRNTENCKVLENVCLYYLCPILVAETVHTNASRLGSQRHEACHGIYNQNKEC